MNPKSNIIVNTNSLKILALFCLGIGVVPLLVFQPLQPSFPNNGQGFVLAIFSLAILGIISGSCLFIYAATIRIDAIAVEVIFLFGKYSMKWEDIEMLEIAGGNLALINHNQRITLPSFEFWGGENKQEAKQQFIQFLQDNQISPTVSWRTFLPIFKNTKIV